MALNNKKYKEKTSKGQSSAEFVVIMGFMILVLLAFFIIIQEKMIQANEEQNEFASNEIMNMLIAEIRLAESVSDNYYREFYLPISLNQLDYNISIIPGVANTIEILITYSGKEKVYFLEEFVNTSSTVGIGMNNITKDNGEIIIRHMG